MEDIFYVRPVELSVPSTRGRPPRESTSVCVCAGGPQTACLCVRVWLSHTRKPSEQNVNSDSNK